MTSFASADFGVLDNPAWSALTGTHAGLAFSVGQAARYPEDVSPFAAVQDVTDPRAWADLAALLEPGDQVALTAPVVEAPASWEVTWSLPLAQMIDVSVEPQDDSEALRLAAADVPEMLDLVQRTDPGPLRPRTIELGTFLGFRHEGNLIAMAGQRMRPEGWVEISAVCTDPEHRGKGLAARLVRAVAADARRAGERPFLHVSLTNPAMRLYEQLGFQTRRQTTVVVARPVRV